MSITKKGVTTTKEEIVEADGQKTVSESTFKKNGSGTSKTKVYDAEENIISTTLQTVKVNTKKNTVTNTTVSTNADGSKSESQAVTDKDGNTKVTETVVNSDDTVTNISANINADGTGSSTSITVDADNNEISRTEEKTTVDDKGTVKTSSVTAYAYGSSEKNTEKRYASGTIYLTRVTKDAKGNTIKISEKIRKTKKGNTGITFSMEDTKVKKKSSRKTTISGKVTIYKSGKVKITLTITDSKSNIKEKNITLKPEEVDFDATDIMLLIEKYL